MVECQCGHRDDPFLMRRRDASGGGGGWKGRSRRGACETDAVSWCFMVLPGEWRPFGGVCDHAVSCCFMVFYGGGRIPCTSSFISSNGEPAHRARTSVL